MHTMGCRNRRPLPRQCRQWLLLLRGYQEARRRRRHPKLQLVQEPLAGEVEGAVGVEEEAHKPVGVEALVAPESVQPLALALPSLA